MTDPTHFAALLATITVWQAKQSNLTPMRPYELVRLFDTPLSQITTVLEVLGWTKKFHRGWENGRRYRRVFWCPNGITLYRRLRGRPSLNSLINSGLTTQCQDIYRKGNI